MRDPQTGERLPWATPLSTPAAIERAKFWKGQLPEEYGYDIDLIPGPTAYNLLLDIQKRMADQGVTVTAEIQQMMDLPVDRPLRGKVAVMPEDARDIRDFKGKPLMLMDFTPGRVPLVLVGNATEHIEALSEKADEMRHYGTDVPDLREAYEAPDVQADFYQWTEQAQDAQAGRTRHAFSKTDAIETEEGWI